MATADLDFNMQITGTADEKLALLEIMIQYAEGKDGVYFSIVTASIDNEEYRFSFPDNKEKLFEALRTSESPLKFHALGPFGRYGELNEVDIFRDMAEAAPNASFEASIAGFAGYADQSLNAKLDGQKLHISTFYLSDDVRGDAELLYISECLPYDTFVETFRLDPEEFTEDMYQDFVIDNIACMDSPAEFFEETGYEEFLEMLEVECPLTEEEYAQIAQEFSVTEYEDFDEYLETGDFECSEDFVYDPIEKKYIKGGRPMMKSNTAYDVTEEIREYLKSKGMPCDDETIANLSVEDAYAIMAGVYGMDDGDEEDDDIDIFDDADDDEDDADETAESSAVCDTACVCNENNESAPAEAAGEADTADISVAEPAEVEAEAEIKDKTTAETESEAETETAAETAVEAEAEIESADETESETENKAAAPKKSAAWLIVLLIAVMLIGLAALVFGLGTIYGEALRELFSLAARLL